LRSILLTECQTSGRFAGPDLRFLVLQALSKKEKMSGLGSPGGDDSDGEDYTLTPRTEAKYNKIDEEFHLIMQRNQLNGGRVSQHFLREQGGSAFFEGAG
jgi:Holliday junction regulator protein family C-terminal repeat